jgi:hypothetical protein
VSGLVDEDQEGQPDDRNEDAHTENSCSSRS